MLTERLLGGAEGWAGRRFRANFVGWWPKIAAVGVYTSGGCGGLGWFRKSDGPGAGGATPGPCTERAVLPMRSEGNGCELRDDEVAERAIVLQVLRDDCDQRWPRAELESEIYDIDPLAISDALERLREEGVVHLAGELVWASRCARRLDALGMISI
jgi:hypothetical protein